jgi:hypothetical protein
VGIVTLFAVAPVALALGLPRLATSDSLVYYTQDGTSLSAPFNVDKGWHANATQRGGVVTLAWPTLRSIGGHMNYVVLRAPASNSVFCDVTGGGAQCRLLGSIVDYTNSRSFAERPPPGRWEYRIGAKASWIDDPTAGDIYVVSPPIVVAVRR